MTVKEWDKKHVLFNVNQFYNFHLTLSLSLILIGFSKISFCFYMLFELNEFNFSHILNRITKVQMFLKIENKGLFG